MENGAILSTFAWSSPVFEEFLIEISKAVLVFRKYSDKRRDKIYLSVTDASPFMFLNIIFAMEIG
jgi:hypothetical protein